MSEVKSSSLMTLSPHELSSHAIELVVAWSDGMAVPGRGTDHHLESPTHGRLRVHARSRRSKSLLWFHVLDPGADRYDAAVLIEFDTEDRVAAAWKLSAAEVRGAATSSTSGGARRVLKLPVGGDWTATAARVDLPS
jgi:hypothetical protein